MARSPANSIYPLDSREAQKLLKVMGNQVSVCIKIKKIRDEENKRWSALEIKADKNNWSQARILEARKDLQRRLDKELVKKFY